MEIKPTCYLAFGDSLTEGCGADYPDQHWVAQLFQHLKHSDQCCLRNFGVSGTRSSELLELMQNPAITRMISRATHLSVSTGGCDFIELWESGPITFGGLYKTMRKVKQNAQNILHHLRAHNPKAEIYVLGFYIPLPLYQLGIKRASWLVRTLNHFYAGMCQRVEAKFFDPFSLFLDQKELFSDEVHPNQQGYNAISEQLIQRLFRPISIS
ncbi:SGNH/GDSL hydrolase family protein [Risungbinella massiliensis]|uniref:SGNH/GDSL hydrolase family protein n=1 Tax=Risungbinella massiliensis TaxID=1329796 RepID=UPI0005CBD8F4|nr:GDSL-type esterase/lipase family protein [Risungbinella massiliensis]